ncbi:MAG: triphosphoribosyl-dephospho-CoA synthase [Planctomycetaceae bacterium]
MNRAHLHSERSTASARERLADLIRRACVLEATARKPGNVHPAAAFDDLRYDDFVRAAQVAAPELARANELGVGRAVFHAITRTRDEAGNNVNLGIALSIAPLAAVPAGTPLVDGIDAVLDSLTRDDASFVYRAIRLARPGGLGAADEEDGAAEPTRPLREVMALAAERDAIAAEYAAGFPLVLRLGLPFLMESRHVFVAELARVPTDSPARAAEFLRIPLPGEDIAPWEEPIIALHLRLMATRPDTLIARKCGVEIARESATRAARVLEAGWPHAAEGREELARLDDWLRADGHRRNPGTTADLVAASLFAALREGISPLALEDREM